LTSESPNSKRQPITSRPEVGPHPNDSNEQGRIVYFGTGKYLGGPDDSQTGQITQRFYGIWDPTDDSDNRIQWDDFDRSNPNNDDGGGWVFHLTMRVGDSDDVGDLGQTNRGERTVNDPLLRDERVIFTTTIPSNNPCEFGGKRFVMELDRLDGGRLAVSPVDLNEDTDRDSADRGDNGNRTGGILTDTALACSLAAIMGEDENKAVSNSSGEIQVIDNEPAERRQSWRELR